MNKDDNKDLKMGKKPQNENQWKCELCEKILSTKYAKEIHERTVHFEIKDNLCTKCDRAFADKHSLQNHMNSVHKKIKEFKCNDCTKSFAIKFI